MALKSASLLLKAFHSSASSSVSLRECSQFRRHCLTQPVVHEDEDGEFSSELLRCDVDELEALPGLVDADQREVAEGLHHGGALACDFDDQILLVDGN